MLQKTKYNNNTIIKVFIALLCSKIGSFVIKRFLKKPTRKQFSIITVFQYHYCIVAYDYKTRKNKQTTTKQNWKMLLNNWTFLIS